jgi:hypothetical protein
VRGGQGARGASAAAEHVECLASYRVRQRREHSVEIYGFILYHNVKCLAYQDPAVKMFCGGDERPELATDNCIFAARQASERDKGLTTSQRYRSVRLRSVPGSTTKSPIIISQIAKRVRVPLLSANHIPQMRRNPLESRRLVAVAPVSAPVSSLPHRQPLICGLYVVFRYALRYGKFP